MIFAPLLLRRHFAYADYYAIDAAAIFAALRAAPCRFSPLMPLLPPCRCRHACCHDTARALPLLMRYAT